MAQRCCTRALMPQRMCSTPLLPPRSCPPPWLQGDYEHMHQITQYIACHRSELGSHERGAEGGREATEGDAMLRFHLMNFG